jgi:hypothetical protein
LREPVERVACYSKKFSEDAKDWHDKTHIALTCDFTNKFIEKNIVSSYNKFVLRTNKGGYRRVASCLASSVGSDITLAIMDDPQGEEGHGDEGEDGKHPEDAGVVGLVFHVEIEVC